MNKHTLEYEDAPSGFVTLYNYKEPLMPFATGHGYEGVLLYDGKTDKVQCHFCGSWFFALGNHLGKEHNMKASEYKTMTGLRQTTALIGEEYRKKLIANGLDVRLKNLIPGGKKTEKEKKKVAAGLKKNNSTRQHQNERGTCPEQLLDRLRDLAKELGRTPLTDEVGFYETLVNVYGSYKNAIKKAGLKYRKPGQNVHYNAKKIFTREELLELIREFTRKQGREPSYSDVRRSMLPSGSTYVRHFGSWVKAKKIALGT